MQLGHPIGEKCLNPEQATDDDFTVISAHGIQQLISVDVESPAKTNDYPTASLTGPSVPCNSQVPPKQPTLLRLKKFFYA